MPFLSLPNEVLLLIAEGLSCDQRALNALAQTSRRTFQLLNSYLYIYNIQYSHASALNWAATNGVLATARRAIQLGAPVEKEAEDFTRAMRNKARQINILAPPYEDVLFHPDRRAHPIMRAAWLDHVDVVRLLIEHGVDPDYQNAAGNTPLALAAFFGYINLVHLLLENGANATLKDVYQNRSPLTHAAAGEHAEILGALLDNIDKNHLPEAKD